jgi:hypothetical protein
MPDRFVLLNRRTELQ